MKKIGVIVFAAFILIGTSAPVFAATQGTRESNRLKELKKVQREKKAQAAANPATKEKGFWQKEAERSGFAGTGAMLGNAVSGVMPLEKPNSCKVDK